MGADRMTSIAKALYAFYSGFGLPAYPEDGVPSDAALPYITYTIVQPDFICGTVSNIIRMSRRQKHPRLWNQCLL